MKAIILAAGEGKRMRPLTEALPKPLLRIKGRPILDYVFDALPEEISEVIVVVRYLGDKIKSYLGNKYRGRKISFAEGSDKGNAHSFLAVKKFIGDEKFLLLNGDEFPNPVDVASCLQKDLSVITFNSHNPKAHGMIAHGPDGTILEIVEKPESWPMKIAAGGIYVLNSKIFDYQPLPDSKGEFYFTSLLNQFIKDHQVWPVLSKNFIGDITTPEDLARVAKLV